MLPYPTVRNKDLITHAQWPNPINNTVLQDGQLPPDLLANNLYGQDNYQTQLQSPFSSPRLQFLPSSGCSSPTFSSSSPAFSSARSPATNFSGDFPVFDGSWSEAPSMSVASSYNPAFHIAPPAPSPYPYPNAQYSTPQYMTQHSPMLAQSGITTNTHGSWDTDANVQLLSPAHAQKAHKRAASGSSGKTGSNSPQAAATFAGQYQNSNPKKSLPTPVQTPVQNSFLAPAFQNYDPLTHNGDTAAAEQAMRQAVMEQHSHGSNQTNNSHPTAEDDTSFHYSLAPSVSSLSHHNSPVTPQTTYDEFDDGSKAVVHDFNNQNTMSMGVPKLNRTISDIYQDELYNTTVVPTSSQQMRKANTNMGSQPYRNLFADRLNAANQGHLSARSQSPAGTPMNRERSPFRQGSPLAADFRQQARLQSSGLGSALQLPGTQQDAQGEIKTISPKDALLEYNEGPDDLAHGLPSLFPTNDMALSGSNMTSRRQSATSAFQPTLAYNSMEAFPTQYATQAAGLQPMNNFMQPQLPTQDLHANNTLLQQTPGFPASLPTMESTNSDRIMETSSKRPSDTSSDSGTYTCTYHGCTLRFETPAKLQKHKREAHRQTMAGQNGESASSLALRNSQAGPHKCERINPSTGKPCNSIFSRPYDLTRHEDTIHNARKQKVRCHLCTEEKTFSRNDALTRHMRVVHPEVDWPGKQRRKGQ